MEEETYARCCNIVSSTDILTENDYENIKLLHSKFIGKTSAGDNCEVEDLELCQIFSASQLHLLCSNQDLMENFCSYLFIKRYGWSDTDLRKRNDSGQFFGAEDKQKMSISYLDDLIEWFLENGRKLTTASAVHSTIKKVSNYPVARNKLIVYFMDWLKVNCRDLSKEEFILIKNAVIASLCDVWSAIRNACASRLLHIIPLLYLEQVEDLFIDLQQICLADSSKWQSKEGAVMGINFMLKSFQKEKCAEPPRGNLPESLANHTSVVVFSLLSHPQLSVRENAVKTLASYISASNIQSTEETFDQVLDILNDAVQSSDEALSYSVDAFTAEGFLNVCLILLKALQLDALIQKLQFCVSVFQKFLLHPASTVRQTTSSLFKLIAIKCCRVPHHILNILYMLTKVWAIDVQTLSEPLDTTDPSTVHSKPSVINSSGTGALGCWEIKEGVLLSYELICKLLIKNHLFHTFGQSTSNMSPCSNIPLSSSLSGAEFPQYKSDRESSNSPKGLKCNKSISILNYLKHESFNQSCSSRNGDIISNDSNHEIQNKSNDVPEPVDMSSVLEKMIFQSVDCLTHSQWELRRIGQQVLPCLAEVVRWYDPKLLEKICLQSPSTNSSPLTFGAQILLKESLLHGVKLKLLLNSNVQSSWQNQDNCRRTASDLLAAVHRILEQNLQTMRFFIERNVFDKHFILSSQILLVSYNNISLEQNQKCEIADLLISFWKDLFAFAHPNTRVAVDLLEKKNIESFISPFDGYLSCCLLKPDSKLQCARQVEKQFLTEIHTYLPEFFCDLTNPGEILPIIAHYCGMFVTDNAMWKSLFESLNVIGKKELILVSSLHDREVKLRILKCIYCCLRELSAVVTMKSTDSSKIQRIMTSYLDLCKPINPTKYLNSVFMAICSRIDEGIKVPSDMSPRPRDDEDIFLWSSNIHIVCEPEEKLVIDDDSDDQTFPESLTLNTSNNSGTFILKSPNRSNKLSDMDSAENADTDETSDESDWDSFSDEEQGSDVLKETFNEFLKKLRILNAAGKPGEFDKVLAALEEKERRLIQHILLP